MTANAFGGDDATCGAMTSGGTESILMAMKVNHYDVTNPATMTSLTPLL